MLTSTSEHMCSLSPQASARRLQEVEQACAELQMQVKTAEEVAKDEVRRGKAKLDELVTKRVEMVSGLGGCGVHVWYMLGGYRCVRLTDIWVCSLICRQDLEYIL